MAPTFTFRTFAWNAPLQDGIAGIFNASDPGQSPLGDRVFIKQVRTRVLQGQALAALGFSLEQGHYGLFRITATSGGTLQTEAKYRTADGALASLQMTANPDAVTTSDLFRTMVIPQQLNIAASNPGPMSWPLLAGQTPRSTAYRSIDVLGTNTEPIRLAQNEGVAFKPTQYGQPCVLQIEVVMLDSVTGATGVYSFPAYDGGLATAAIFSIFNTSTDAMDILSIQVAPWNSSLFPLNVFDGAPSRRLVLMDGFTGGDTTFTPVQHNIKKTAPPDLLCVKGPFVARRRGQDAGVPVDWNTNTAVSMPLLAQWQMGHVRRQVLQMGWDASGNAMNALYPLDWDVLYKAGKYDEGIRLAAGEGIAVAGGLLDQTTTTMCFDIYECEFLFTAERPFVGASAAMGV